MLDYLKMFKINIWSTFIFVQGHLVYIYRKIADNIFKATNFYWNL